MFSQSSNPQIPINQSSTTPEPNTIPEKVSDKPQTPPRPAIPPSEEANKKRFKEVLDKKLTPQSAKNAQKADATSDVGAQALDASSDELEEVGEETPKPATLFMLASGQTKTPVKTTAQNVESSLVSTPLKEAKPMEHEEIILTSDQAKILTNSDTQKPIIKAPDVPVKSTSTLAKNTLADTTETFSQVDEKDSFDEEVGDDVLQAVGSSLQEKKTISKDDTSFSNATSLQAQIQITATPQSTDTALSSGMANTLGRTQEARIAAIQIINQLASQMTQMVSNGQTETTVTLQHPPIFQGASITITQLESAPKEFNVTFTNLTDPTARMLIEMKDNQDSLRANLIAKGYTLHMVTIEPKLELREQSMETETGTSFSKRDEKYEESGESDFEAGVT
jgi:hypothetical protein